MKYRMLTQEELEIFEEDLKHFLIANGVHSEEWEEMNKTDVDRATQLVGLFSDVVLQKVYEKVKFIENRSKNACLVFKLDSEKVALISINSTSEEVDLQTPESIHQALTKQSDKLSFFKTEKKYSKNREEEIHQMLEQGCVNSSEAFWIMLEKVIS